MFQAPPRETGDLSGDPSRDEGVTTAGRLAWQLDNDQPAEGAGAAVTVEAQWALWGKDGDESDYGVLRCSKGAFGIDDFHGIVTRYASGAKATLPQYTACWIPAGPRDRGHRAVGDAARRARAADAADDKGYDGYLAVGIHELADPGPSRSDGRARTAGGRDIEYIRLFCVRYAELAEHGVTYADLVEAVRGKQLSVDLTEPIKVELPEIAPRSVPASARRLKLAENVATLLLTTRPVCVLGAEAATAEDRLAFIESVMSLLPYGLRTTLSASTWASSTAQVLKLRLFFSNAKRDDAGRTVNVVWDQPAELDFSTAKDRAPELYLNWLRHASPGAVAALSGRTDPVRFNPDEIRTMVADLPEDMPVEDTLKALANSLRHNHRAAVSAEVQRLRRYLGRTPGPAERPVYRHQIAQLGLLDDHPELHHSTRASVYRVLLDLAFEKKLSYASYCAIEDAIGHPPRGTLRAVLLKRRFDTFVPWVLVAKGDPDIADQVLVESLAAQRIPAAAPLSVLQRDIQDMRRGHRPAPYRIAVWYLRARADDPRSELKRRGYLADTLEAVFPGDRQSNRQAQRIDLERTLRFVHGAPLSRGQIGELFGNPTLCPTKAFEAAVAHLASSRRDGQFIAQQAAYARLRYAGYGDDAQIIRRGIRRRSRRRIPNISRRRTPNTIQQDPGTVWLVPKVTVIGFVVLLVAVLLAVLWYTGAHP